MIRVKKENHRSWFMSNYYPCESSQHLTAVKVWSALSVSCSISLKNTGRPAQASRCHDMRFFGICFVSQQAEESSGLSS